MSVGGIGAGRGVGFGGLDDDGDVEGDASEAPAAEAKIVRGKSGPWGAGQTLDREAQSILGKLEDVKGSKPRILGAFDTAASVESTGRSISRSSGFSTFLGAMTGAGGGRISGYDAERLIAAAKDFQKITRSEFQALAKFIDEKGGRCEKDARAALVEFVRRHAPEDIARDVK